MFAETSLMPHLHFERNAFTRRSTRFRAFNFLCTLLFALIVFLETQVANCAFQWNQAAIQEIVDYHNQFRMEQSITANLTWSKNLQEKAQAYANQLSCSSLQHSEQNGCGENLAKGAGSNGNQRSLSSLMELWKKEDFAGNVYNHATQMLWRESALVGCGVFQEGGCTTLVCNYYPPGNFIPQTYNTSPEPCGVVPDEPTISLQGNCRALAAALQCDGASRKKGGAGDGYAPGLPPRPNPPAGPPPPAKPPANPPPSYPPSSTSSTTGTATSTSTTSKASPKTSDVPTPAPKPPTCVPGDLISSEYNGTATKPSSPCSGTTAVTGAAANSTTISPSSTNPSATATAPYTSSTSTPSSSSSAYTPSSSSSTSTPSSSSSVYTTSSSSSTSTPSSSSSVYTTSSSSSAYTPSSSTHSCNAPKSAGGAASSPMPAPPAPLQPEIETGGKLTTADDLSSGFLEANSEGAAVHRASHSAGLLYFQLICIFIYSVVLFM